MAPKPDAEETYRQPNAFTKQPPRKGREHKGRVVLVSCILLLWSLAATPSVTAETPQCGSDDSFVLPPGEVLVVNETLTLERDCEITIQGNILGEPASGASIIIKAGGGVTISGHIQAGSGSSGNDVFSTNGPAIAGEGTEGGSIIIAGGLQGGPCGEGCILLDAAAVLSAGDGGSGGTAVAHQLDDGRPAQAYGGDGGRSGALILLAASIVLSGVTSLDAAMAGPGGDAFAAGPYSEAIGGEGGDASPVFVRGLSAEDHLAANQDALGGTGGFAAAGFMAVCGVSDTALFGCHGEPDEDECDAQAFLDALSDGDSTGLNAFAFGGFGGSGIIEGGQGGGAIATACPNPGKGDDGMDGGEEEDGDDGELGPSGGTGFAHGGNGGAAWVFGGDGGTAEANGGQGGRGGNGGDGGDDTTICHNNPGAAGDGGKGGWGGASNADGGDGGDAVLSIGKPGIGGVPSGTPGTGGSGGSPGVPGRNHCEDDRPVGDPGVPGDVGNTGPIDHNFGEGGETRTGTIGEFVDVLEDWVGDTCGNLCG